ncbi:Acyl carrier protein 1, mitochondrial-like protein [Drosera capensis]
MASLLRRAVTSHIRVSIIPTLACLTHHGSKTSNQQLLGNSISLRWMSSHDDHLTKEEVVDRVLAVIKDFPKVDSSKAIF